MWSSGLLILLGVEESEIRGRIYAWRSCVGVKYP